jgi:hypothetical protein
VLDLPCVSDGVIQGDAVRVLLRANTDGMQQIQSLAERSTGSHRGGGAGRVSKTPSSTLLGGGPGGHIRSSRRSLPALPHWVPAHCPCPASNLTQAASASFTAAESVSFRGAAG